jgi:Ca-activated chloride channel homolog
MTAPIRLTTQWGRAPISALNSAQVNYLLVGLAAAQAPPQRAALNLCLVLDRSGSMQGAKIAALRAAVSRVIDRLSDDDVLSVIVFDEQAEVIVPAALIGDRTALQAAVAAISEQGGTAMAQGLRAAQQQIGQHRDARRVNRIVLLTDGQTWGDEDECRRLAAELGAAATPISAFGLGDEWNARLLEDLAAAGGGQADYIADAGDIDRFFQTTLRAVQTTVLQQIRLVLRPTAGVELRALHRVLPLVQALTAQPSTERSEFLLGDLTTDIPQQVLIDMLVPARTAGEYRLAALQVFGRPLGGAEQLLAERELVLELTDQAALVTVDPAVMNLAERVSAFKLQTRALQELEAGSVAGATRSLRAAATRLLDLGETVHAAQVEQQATRLEQQQQLSAADEKSLRYVTRRLTQRLDETE